MWYIIDWLRVISNVYWETIMIKSKDLGDFWIQ